MKKTLYIFILMFLCGCSGRSAQSQETLQPDENGHFYIDNGTVKLGVDMNGGGSVFYFAESSSGRNLLNHADKGRYVQQSYYGDAEGSLWDGKPWNWNPVQGGGYTHEPARVLESELSKKSIWIRSLPKHWATAEDITDAVMEEHIELDGRIAHIKYKFLYTGEKDHAPRHQELPAVFVDYDLPNMVYYNGDEPWEKDELRYVVPGWPNEYHESTENWAAYVDQDNWGIGVFFPGTKGMTAYRFEGDPGPRGGGCSYFAPVQQFAITSGLNYEYDVYLMIGNIDEIREAFGKIHKEYL